MLESFGLSAQKTQSCGDAEAIPWVKVTANAKTKWKKSNTVTAGAEDATWLCHAGKRLLKPERNLSMAHAPCAGKEVFCWDWNSQGGCIRWDKCDRKHDTVSDQNLHWAGTAAMIRRGGRRKRPVRIIPENIDGMADQLRESIKRTHGGNPLIPSNAWRPKTDGASRTSIGETLEAGRGSSGRKATKRELDWNGTLVNGNGKMPPSLLRGEDGMEDASFHRALTQSRNGEIDIGRRKPHPPEEVEEIPASKPRTTVDRISAEDVRRYGNPAAPDRPDDLRDFDLATLGGKLIGAMYDDDTWVGAPEDTHGSYRPPNTTRLNDKQKR